MSRLPVRIVTYVLLLALCTASISAQDDALPDLNGIWRLGNRDSSRVRFQQVDNVVTARFLKVATKSTVTGEDAEEGAPDTSSTSDSMTGEFVNGKLTGQFNLYYYGRTLPNNVESGWQFRTRPSR